MAEPSRLPGFGNPESLQQMVDATERAATSLEELRTLVQTDVSATLRRAFDGEGARGLEWFAHRLSEALIPQGGQGSPARVYHTQIKPAVEAMRGAQQLLREAEEYINRNNLYITSDLRVAARPPGSPYDEALIAVGQGKLDAARAAAEQARRIRAANAAFARALEMTRQHLDALGQIGGPGRRAPTVRPPGMAAGRKLDPLNSKEDAFRANERSEAARDRRLDQQYTRQYERGENFREELLAIHPMPRDGRTYVAHHNFPVARSADFERVGIFTTNPIYGSWVEAGRHQAFSTAYNNAWDSFFTRFPNPSQAQVLHFGRVLARTYGYQVQY